jgi:hypothetical protein
MAHVEKSRKIKPPAGYASAQHEMFEDRARHRAEQAERDGKTCLSMAGRCL